MSRLLDRTQEEDQGHPTPCRVWTGQLDKDGYGRISGALAHRSVYEQEVGPIPEGFDLDHLCRTRGCVNPEHLEAIPHRENVLRGDTIVAANAAKTECINGHPFDTVNTYIRPDGSRGCRACNTEAQARFQEKQTAEPKPTSPSLPARAHNDGPDDMQLRRIRTAPKTTSNRQLARELGLSPTTVGKHRGQVRGNYDEQDKDAAMASLVLSAGNLAEAARRLRDQRILPTISPNTIKKWAEDEPMRLQRVRARLQPQLDSELLAGQEDNARLLTELEAQTAVRLGENLDRLRPGELPAALRSVAQAKSATLEKRSLLRGEPTQITETRSVPETLAALRRLGVRVDIPGLTLEGSETPSPDPDGLLLDPQSPRQLPSADPGLDATDDRDPSPDTPQAT